MLRNYNNENSKNILYVDRGSGPNSLELTRDFQIFDKVLRQNVASLKDPFLNSKPYSRKHFQSFFGAKNDNSEFLGHPLHFGNWYFFIFNILVYLLLWGATLNFNSWSRSFPLLTGICNKYFIYVSKSNDYEIELYILVSSCWHK